MDSLLRHESDAKIAVMLSLFLQLLLLLATFRKRTGNSIFISFVFVIYHLSFYVSFSTFVFIASIQYFTLTKMPMGLWAAIMLLHSSGQERLTAYSLTENEDWAGFTLKISSQILLQLGLFSIPKDLPIPTWIMLCLSVWRIGFRARRLRMGSKAKRSHGRFLFDDSEIVPQPMMINADDESRTVLRAHCLLKSSLRCIAGFKYCNSAVMDEVRRSFLAITDSNHAIRLVEIELNFMYESFHTDGTIRKHLNHHWAIGYTLIRIVEPVVCVMALIFYLTDSSNHFQSADVSRADYVVTTLLLCGTVILEFLSYITIICSVWTIAALYELDRPACNTLFQVVPQRKRWWSEAVYEVYHSAPRRVRFARNLFRRWSENISKFNFRNYSIKDRFHHERWKACLPPFDLLTNTPNFFEWLMFVSGDWYTDQIGSFVFEHLQKKETSILTALKSEMEQNDEEYFKRSIIVWHNITEHFFQYISPNEEGEYSKILSDYMAYLLFMKPQFVSKSEIYTLENNIEHDWDVATLVKNKVEELQVYNYAAIWDIISSRWVDLLLYAAHKPDPTEHVQGLCHGGEFITIVWLLAFHLRLIPELDQSPYNIRA